MIKASLLKLTQMSITGLSELSQVILPTAVHQQMSMTGLSELLQVILPTSVHQQRLCCAVPRMMLVFTNTLS